MRILRVYWIVLSVLFTQSTVFAQDPYSIVINKYNGLSSNSVYNIFQDSKGFIWIATDRGLCRYDGFEFKSFSSPDQTSKAGSNIKEDQWGRIWYTNFDGYLYYIEKGKLHGFPQNEPIGYASYGIDQHRLFVVQKAGIDVYDLRTNKRIKTISLNLSALCGTAMLKEGFVVTTDKIYLIDRSLKLLQLKIAISKKELMPATILSSGKEGFAIAKSNEQKTCYHISKKGVFPQFSLHFDEIIQSTSFAKNNYWFCTPLGVYRYDLKGKLLNNGRPYYSDESISCVLEDREHNLWIATTNKGIHFIPNQTTVVHQTPFEPFRLFSSANELTVADQESHMYRWNKRLETFQLIGDFPFNSNLNTMMVDSVNGYHLIACKNLQITNQIGKRLFTFEIALKDVERLDAKYYAIAVSGLIGFITVDSTLKSKWDPFIETCRRMADQPEVRFIFNSIRGRAVVLDPTTNSIYFSTNQGLFRFQNGKTTPIYFKEKKIYFKQIECIQGILFGIDDNGVLYEVKQDEIVISSLNSKIPSGITIIGLKRINQELFLMGDQEIIYLDPIKRTVNLLNVKITSSDIIDLNMYQGKLLVVLNHGILELQLNQKNKQKIRPLFQFIGFKVNDIPTVKINNSVFAYFERDFEINYALLVYNKQFEVPLYYRINGGKWKQASKGARTLSLASLSSGEYDIEFKLGNQRLHSKLIRFSIEDPLWKQGWFLLSVATVFGAIIYSYFRRKIKAIQRRNAFLAEKLELEKSLKESMLRSVKAQMNPHFFYNALNTIQSFIYENDKRNASTYLSKFSKLTRMILEMSDADRVTLNREIQALTLYIELEEARFDQGLNHTITIDSNINLETTKIPSMLIQPYVENAVKHGLLHKKGVKSLHIEFILEAEQLLKVIIDDNGIGRFKSAELNRMKYTNHQSFATDANLKRLSLLQKEGDGLAIEFIDKLDEFDEPIGTTVVIRIPF